MKEAITVFLVLVFSLALEAQELMTIGEVFDFEIGDEFQISGQADNQPPNADRITITDKYYSVNLDTVFYIRFHDSYSTTVNTGGPPYLTYYFWTTTDTVFYTLLDSSILYYDNGFQYNQYSEFSPNLCDSLVNGCSYLAGPGFEDDVITDEYGKGLGHTMDYFYSGLGNSVLWDNELFYYKKGNFECGIPDLTVGTNEIPEPKSEILIYPNPAKDYVIFEIVHRSILNQQHNEPELSVFNSYGHQMAKLSIYQSGHKIVWDTRSISSGVYMFTFTVNGIVSSDKIVIQK